MQWIGYARTDLINGVGSCEKKWSADMKEIGKKGTDAKRKAGFVPVCPDCGSRMSKCLFEDDEGEPIYLWMCSCEPDPYVDEIEEEEEWQL